MNAGSSSSSSVEVRMGGSCRLSHPEGPLPPVVCPGSLNELVWMPAPLACPSPCPVHTQADRLPPTHIVTPAPARPFPPLSPPCRHSHAGQAAPD